MPEEQKIDFSFEEHGRVTALDRGSMRRLLGVKEIFGQSYGDLSSSIYYALGVVAVYAAGATPLALAIAGLFFVCTALSYTELTVAMPASGGSQLFARRAFNNDLISFTAGWVLLLDYILTIAISAFTIGPYLGHFYPILKTPEINLLFTAGIIAFLTILNVIGIKESTLLCLILAVFDIAMRTLLILLGLYAVFKMRTLIGYFSNIGTEPTWERFIRGVTIAMVAYTGIETISQMSGEAKDYKIVIPKAMTRTVVAVLLMSLGVGFISVCAITPQELGTKWISDPVAGIVAGISKNIMYGEYLAPIVAVFGAIILFIATNAGIVGASRLAYSMSASYQVPAQLSKLHHRFKTPYIGLVIFSSLAVVTVAIARSTEELVKLYSFGAMLAFGITHLSLIGLRIREPELERPFKVKPSIPIGGGRSIPITAIIGLAATFGTWAVVVLDSKHTRYLGFVWLAIGVISYFIYREKSGMPLARTLEIEKISMPEFKEMAFKKILVPTRGGADTETVQIASRLAKENGAHLVAISVMEIPATLPLDDIYSDKWDVGTKALARASAIAREYGITVETKLLQSRSAAQTVCEVAKEDGCDLIVLGAASAATGIKLSNTISYILSNSPCRLWLCSF